MHLASGSPRCTGDRRCGHCHTPACTDAFYRPAGGVLDGILSRPEHAWFTEGAESESARIRAEMTRRYGMAGR